MVDVVWKVVPGFPRHRVSSDGRVASSDGTRPLTPMMTGQKRRQYQTVELRHDGRRRVVKVHRLVLEVFVGPPPAGAIACHRNDDNLDNRVSNLYWGTWADNARDRVRNGNHAGQRLSVDQVREIRRRRRAGERGVDLAAEFGVTQQIIWNVYSGRTGSHVED